MKNKKTYWLFFWCLLNFVALQAQTNSLNDDRPIFLQNPSFEGVPMAGNTPNYWQDCNKDSKLTPPDTQPGFFGVENTAIDKDTYLGLVVRDNNTWESVSQELENPMRSDRCYLFQLALAQSEYYISYSMNLKQQVNYNTPVILRIWGGDADCDKKELLAETLAVEHYEWDSYTFYLCPSDAYEFITFEAYYNTHDDNSDAYNGNLLIDDASPLYPLPYAYGEISWNDIPKIDYIQASNIEQLETLVIDYGSQIYFESSVLPYSIYMDAAKGLRYGNRFFDTIISAMNTITHGGTLYIAVKADENGNSRRRINELKEHIRAAEVPLSFFKIKTVDKFEEENWLVENDFIKMKVVKE